MPKSFTFELILLVVIALLVGVAATLTHPSDWAWMVSPDWTYAIVAVAAIAAIVMLLVKSEDPRIVGVAAFPLIVMANWSLFFVAWGYVLGQRDIASTLIGPIAWAVSLPSVEVQNSVPLLRPWDSIVGFVGVSSLETAALLFVKILRRRMKEHS